MCKSNYLLTAVAEREGWEWHRGSSRRWAPSICHSTPQPPPHPPPAFILSLCLSLVLSFSLSLYLSLCLSICLDTCLQLSIIQCDMFLFMINSTDDILLNVCVPLVLPTGSAKIIILAPPLVGQTDSKLTPLVESVLRSQSKSITAFIVFRKVNLILILLCI